MFIINRGACEAVNGLKCGNKPNRMAEGCLLPSCCTVYVPSWVSVQLIEDCLLTELKHQMEASLPPEDLEQIDQIHVFQLLQAPTEDIKH